MAHSPLSGTAESTVELLSKLKTGDEQALERLLLRYLMPLRRWAHGRLPQSARDMSDTQDLVQDAVMRVLRQLAHFEPAGPGALHKYLRSAVMNRIRDELRRVHRRPFATELRDDLPSDLASPLDLAIGTDALSLYEAALGDLRDEDRELVVARVEWQLDYAAIAAALGKPSVSAASIAVRRALIKLADAMQRRRIRPGA